LERGAKRVNPFLVAGAGNHGPGVEVATAVGAQGPQVTFSSGCPSSLQAIGHAANLIAAGTIDICLAGGTESPLSPVVVAALTRTQELSTTNDDPARASRPFDIRHNGMVLSEGSCFLVLESENSAAERGVHAYAEILGSRSSCDARGLYGVDPDGQAAARAVHGLLRACKMTPVEIDYICAHANGSPTFDTKETRVLKCAFGEFAAQTPISSIKAVLGHPFGAAGAFQTAACALAFEHQVIPPTHNLDTPDPQCDLAHVARIPRESSVATALVTSYGYGGLNSYLLLRKPE
jgi:act minimal PKS ketosynthase (KS/KS alpha)